MAAYAYKEVCYRPELRPYINCFEEKYGREFDGDSNYDGDYWTVVADYIDDLEGQVNQSSKLKQAAEKFLAAADDGVVNRKFAEALIDLRASLEGK